MVQCPSYQWSQHTGLISKDVLTKSEKQNRSSKVFILTQKPVCQTRQTPVTHCPKYSDAFSEDRRAYSSFKQMEMFLPVRTWTRARSILLLLQARSINSNCTGSRSHILYPASSANNVINCGRRNKLGSLNKLTGKWGKNQLLNISVLLKIFVILDLSVLLFGIKFC